MMEYTWSVGIFLIFLLALDRALDTRVLRLSNRSFWITALIFAGFQFVLDNYFTRTGIWTFNSAEVIGVFIPFIPIENMVYGFELLALTIILYSFFARPRRY
jgi:lycopene cyclase domain-containing protein